MVRVPSFDCTLPPHITCMCCNALKAMCRPSGHGCAHLPSLVLIRTMGATLKNVLSEGIMRGPNLVKRELTYRYDTYRQPGLQLKVTWGFGKMNLTTVTCKMYAIRSVHNIERRCGCKQLRTAMPGFGRCLDHVRHPAD